MLLFFISPFVHIFTRHRHVLDTTESLLRKAYMETMIPISLHSEASRACDGAGISLKLRRRRATSTARTAGSVSEMTPTPSHLHSVMRNYSCPSLGKAGRSSGHCGGCVGVQGLVCLGAGIWWRRQGGGSGDCTKRQLPSRRLGLCYVWNIFGTQYMQKQPPPNG